MPTVLQEEGEEEEEPKKKKKKTDENGKMGSVNSSTPPKAPPYPFRPSRSRLVHQPLTHVEKGRKTKRG